MAWDYIYTMGFQMTVDELEGATLHGVKTETEERQEMNAINQN